MLLTWVALQKVCFQDKIKIIFPYHTFKCIFLVLLSDKPILPMLISFKCKNGEKINVLEKIGVKYFDFGVLLLNDKDGCKVSAIEYKNMREAKSILTDIVKLWLQGVGRPVSWKTLVEVLEDIGLHRLSEDIQSLFL